MEQMVKEENLERRVKQASQDQKEIEDPKEMQDHKDHRDLMEQREKRVN